MYSYTFVQWLLFYYIYCFMGWVWESSYVSIKKGKLTNRGFMTGPFLPIYGFGAIIVLLATIPVRDKIFLVFCLGMTAATALEYVTGAAMEAIFKVRYWDYSSKRFNLNGHICLASSLAWGVFSVLMIQVIHKPIEKAVLDITYSIQEILAFLLSIGISVDLGLAVRDALDLREMLLRIKENTEEMLNLQERVDTLMNRWNDEKKVFKEKVEFIAMSYKEDEKGYLARIMGNLKARLEILEQVKQQTDNVRSEYYKEFIEELDSMKEKFTLARLKMDLRKTKVKHHTSKILKRNPDAVSVEYEEALQEIKDMKK